MNCFQATLDISYVGHVINDAVRRTIKESVTLEDVVTFLKKRKLKWYRHVIRGNKPSALGKKKKIQTEGKASLRELEEHSQWQATQSYGGN